MAIRWSLWRRRLLPPIVIISAIAIFFGSLWFYYYSTYCWQHTDLLCIPTETVKSWLKIAAGLTQIAGVFLLIKSIDQNINLLKGNTFIGTLELGFQQWLATWRGREFSAGGTSYFTIGGSVGITITSGDRSNMSLAERIKLLETAVDDVRNKHSELVGETRDLATKVQKSEQKFIQRLENETKSIKLLLSDISIGGLSNQIFGMYLIIYSATVSIFV
ncbi:hypothetical protein J2X32_001762 [Rheinheimera pacifica]|uniref:hypothetical protein n=1 Tax=Rheinheimera pacifica TaxID=173990 RepID=UPI002861A465|nr:hypothetical protein [Rheinheimera pacifica]MDR6983128.1 hypothetical protein [Rheinheimera pacifica]